MREKSMAEAAKRPEAGEKAVFLEFLLKEEEAKDFPRAIPKEAKANEREKDMLNFRRAKRLLLEENFCLQSFDKTKN